MLDKETIIHVTNRSSSSVSYTVPDLNVRRSFAVGETKEVVADEIKRLSYKEGGYVLIRDYLIIDNKELVAEILGTVEPEYWYTVEDIKDLLLNGSLEALEDCLDFAPAGVIDLVKEYAVKLRINDLSKREAIFSATGFNVTNAIQVMTWVNESTENEGDHERRRRRVVEKSEPEPVVEKPARRTAAPVVEQETPAPETVTTKPAATSKYKIVTKS